MRFVDVMLATMSCVDRVKACKSCLLSHHCDNQKHHEIECNSCCYNVVSFGCQSLDQKNLREVFTQRDCQIVREQFKDQNIELPVSWPLSKKVGLFVHT